MRLLLRPAGVGGSGAWVLCSIDPLTQREHRELRDREFTNQLNQAEEKQIPYEDILRYPENWPDIRMT